MKRLAPTDWFLLMLAAVLLATATVWTIRLRQRAGTCVGLACSHALDSVTATPR